MAEKRAAIGRLTPLQGVLITSRIARGRFDRIVVPEADPAFVTVAPRDIPGSNRLRVLDAQVPLLSSGTITYRGQPLLALFGPDRESALIKAGGISVSYVEDEPVESLSVTPYSYTFGNLEEALKEENLQVLQRSYSFHSTSRKRLTYNRVSVAFDGETLHVEAPTQWPAHVRDSVAEVTGLSKKNVIIHRQPFYAPHDEMLVLPSQLAALCSVAAIKSGRDTEILHEMEAAPPRYGITRKTYYLSNGKPQAEEIRVVVDQGCAAFFREELVNHLYAGLIPLYPVAALTIRVEIHTTNNRPAHFYGGLGYSEALASSEAHYSELAKHTGYNPLSWRMKHAAESPSSAAMVRTDKYAKLKELASSVSKRADFARKNAAYEMQRRMRIRHSTFFRYGRGNGLALAPGIGGFSREYKGTPTQSVQVTLQPNDHVVINTSFYNTGNSAEIWKQIVSDELGVSKKDISFVGDGNELLDSGPSVLNANSGRMPRHILRACQLIKEKRFVEPLPISETVTFFRHPSAKDSLFFSNSWVAIILELEISPLALVPVIRSVWVSITTPKVYEKAAYISKVRHTIVTTLLEAGARLSQSKGFEIDIQLEEEGEGMPSSMTAAVKGAVTAALLTALEQALGSNVEHVPVDGPMILDLLRSTH
ncbi:MAG: molybdopterin-dependent oxidoreductase [Spirochaetales bacterium]|nr:molybdopterin-dependent oxidoreductase [Spirochaetales bacterium]